MDALIIPLKDNRVERNEYVEFTLTTINIFGIFQTDTKFLIISYHEPSPHPI